MYQNEFLIKNTWIKSHFTVRKYQKRGKQKQNVTSWLCGSTRGAFTYFSLYFSIFNPISLLSMYWFKMEESFLKALAKSLISPSPGERHVFPAECGTKSSTTFVILHRTYKDPQVCMWLQETKLPQLLPASHPMHIGDRAFNDSRAPIPKGGTEAHHLQTQRDNQKHLVFGQHPGVCQKLLMQCLIWFS